MQSALVRGSIDAPGQARNNGGTGGAQRPGKVLRIDGALYGGVAAAHNRQAVVMVKGDCIGGSLWPVGLHWLARREAAGAQQVEHQRRVGQAQQALRVAGVAQWQHLRLHAIRSYGLQPIKGQPKQLFELGRFAQQRSALSLTDHFAQRRVALPEHLLGQPECSQQFEAALQAHPGRQCETQPASEFGAFQRAPSALTDQPITHLQGVA